MTLRCVCHLELKSDCFWQISSLFERLIYVMDKIYFDPNTLY